MEIVRIDNYCFDERFYCKIVNGERIFQPSVTHIIGCAYPSSFALMEWRGDVGNKRADEILEETGVDGSFVHESIQGILEGHSVDGSLINSKFSPRRSLKIKRCLKAFLDWHEKFKPVILKLESIVWSDEYGFAGTLDLLCEIEKKTYLVDFKTSKSLHDSHKVQVCAYGMAEKADYVALLHLGNTTKQRYSFKVLTDEERKEGESAFMMTNALFKVLNPNARPSEETFPEVFTLKGGIK